MNSRHKRFILKREGVRESKKSRAGISRVIPYHVTCNTSPFTLSRDEKQPYPRTAHRAPRIEPPQRNPLLSLGSDPQGTALHLESTHDYYHTTSATSQPPFLIPYRSSARRCKPLLSSHIRHFPSPENSPSTHRQTHRQHTHQTFQPQKTYLPTPHAQPFRPPLTEFPASKRPALTIQPHKKKNENRAGQKSKK
jgi:hypothetical protein